MTEYLPEFWRDFPHSTRYTHDNLARFSKLVPDNYALLELYKKQGYTIDGYEPDKGYRFIDRRLLDLGAQRFKDLHYVIQEPEADKTYGLTKKLVVYFTPHAYPRSVSAKARYFENGEAFADLSKYLIRNTYVLRIADVSGMSGSFYLDTEDFLDYTSQVQALIETVAQTLGIARAHILLSGTSKGGTGAIIHALLGGYPAVASDPVLSSTIFAKDDQIFQYDDFPTNMVERINAYETANSPQPIVLLGSSYVLETWPYMQQLTSPRIRIYDTQLQVDNVNEAHAIFTQKNLAFYLAELNKILGAWDIRQVHAPLSQLPDRCEIYPPVSMPWLDVQYDRQSLRLIRRSQADYGWVSLELRQGLNKNQAYRLSVLVDQDSQLPFFLHFGKAYFQRLQMTSREEVIDGKERRHYDFISKYDFNLLGTSISGMQVDQDNAIYELRVRPLAQPEKPELSVILTGNDDYLVHAPALMNQVIRLHPTYKSHFYIVSHDFSEARRLEFDRLGISYTVIQPPSPLKHLDQLQLGLSKWTREAFDWLRIADYLPERVHKAFFMDLDIMLIAPLADIYEAPSQNAINFFGLDYNLSDQEQALARRFRNGEDFSQADVILRKGLLGSTGFMLLDIDKMRQAGLTTQAIEEQLERLLATPPYQGRWQQAHAMGDQGFVWWAYYDLCGFMGPELLALHACQNYQADHLDQAIRVLHFAGNNDLLFSQKNLAQAPNFLQASILQYAQLRNAIT